MFYISYVNNQAFTIVILPVKVRLREDHMLKIYFVLFNKGTKFHFSFVFGLS